MKSLTYTPAHAALSDVLMSASDKPERAGLGLIDVDVQLRRIWQAAQAHGGERRLVARAGEQLIAQLRSMFARSVPAPACSWNSKPPDWPRPRIDGGFSENTCASRIVDSAMVARLAIVVGAVLLALALVPILERDERHAGVLAAAGEVESGQREHAS